MIAVHTGVRAVAQSMQYRPSGEGSQSRSAGSSEGPGRASTGAPIGIWSNSESTYVGSDGIDGDAPASWARIRALLGSSGSSRSDQPHTAHDERSLLVYLAQVIAAMPVTVPSGRRW